jgi:hypothetical protein
MAAFSPMLEVHKGVVGPQAPAQVFTSDQLTGVLEEGYQDLDGLMRYFEARRALIELGGRSIQRERPEADDAANASILLHDNNGRSRRPE